GAGRPGRKARDLLDEVHDAARVAREIAGEEFEERGLAGAVRADDQAPLARRDLERYIVDGGKPAERPLQALDAKRRHILLTPGTTPSGINTTMNTNTKPSSMFQRSMYDEAQSSSSSTLAAPTS